MHMPRNQQHEFEPPYAQVQGNDQEARVTIPASFVIGSKNDRATVTTFKRRQIVVEGTPRWVSALSEAIGLASNLNLAFRHGRATGSEEVSAML